MTRYNLSDLPAQLPDGDVELIMKANDMDWTAIDEDAAETIEGRAILHDIAISKYRREQFHSGIF